MTRRFSPAFVGSGAWELRPCYPKSDRPNLSMRVPPIPRPPFVAVACAIAVAACGSSHGIATRSGIQSQPIAFANCMRTHGVPSFPDPSGGGAGVNLAGTGINPQSPAFKSARLACARLAPGAVGGSKATESEFLAALSFAKCMREQGFPDFPDPTYSDSPPGPILVIGPGLYFRVSPSFDPNTRDVSRAAGACRRQ